MKEVMVDLETFGTKPNSAIASIGAVLFDSSTYEILQPFYQTVRLETNEPFGLEFSGTTIAWWLEQSDAARAALKTPDPVPLPLALSRFIDWFGEDKPIWGNGATMDNVILRNAFDKTSIRCPWGYRNDRCYRTLKNLYPGVLTPTREGVQHNAYDDAAWQTEHLFSILRKMRGE